MDNIKKTLKDVTEEAITTINKLLSERNLPHVVAGITFETNKSQQNPLKGLKRTTLTTRCYIIQGQVVCEEDKKKDK